MFLKWLRGYALIKVEGKFPERFLNVCAKNNILLWNVLRAGEDAFTAYASLSNVSSLKKAANKSKCNLIICEKYGFIFGLKNMKKRKILIVSVLIMVAVLSVLSKFIWRVNFVCDSPFDKKKIIDVLDKENVKVGASISQIDTRKCATELVNEIPELTWANIEIEGMVVYVKFAIGKNEPQMLPINKPCSIVAKKGGVIKSISALVGDKAVEEGDVVHKGDVLITGNIYGIKTSEPIEQVHAYGSVRASTWYRAKCPIQNSKIEYTKSGEFVKINGVKTPFGDFDFSTYDGKFEHQNVVRSDNNFYFPFTNVLLFGWYEINHYELKRIETNLDDSSALKFSYNMANSMLKKQIPENAIVDSIDYKVIGKNPNECIVLTAHCTENIGVEKMLTGPMPTAAPTQDPYTIMR